MQGGSLALVGLVGLHSVCAYIRGELDIWRELTHFRMHQIWGSFLVTLSFLGLYSSLSSCAALIAPDSLFCFFEPVTQMGLSELSSPHSCLSEKPFLSSNSLQTPVLSMLQWLQAVIFLYGIQNNSCYLVTAILPWPVGERLLTPRVSFYVTSSIPEIFGIMRSKNV